MDECRVAVSSRNKVDFLIGHEIYHYYYYEWCVVELMMMMMMRFVARYYCGAYIMSRLLRAFENVCSRDVFFPACGLVLPFIASSLLSSHTSSQRDTHKAHKHAREQLLTRALSLFFESLFFESPRRRRRRRGRHLLASNSRGKKHTR